MQLLGIRPEPGRQVRAPCVAVLRQYADHHRTQFQGPKVGLARLDQRPTGAFATRSLDNEEFADQTEAAKLGANGILLQGIEDRQGGAIGAGVGEVVLYASGSSARQTKVTKDRPVDATVMAIVDQLEVGGTLKYVKE